MRKTKYLSEGEESEVANSPHKFMQQCYDLGINIVPILQMQNLSLGLRSPR